jgi:hypothetical protein
MPRQKHYYGENHLHYLTRSTYRRTRLLDSGRFRQRWCDRIHSKLRNVCATRESVASTAEAEQGMLNVGDTSQTGLASTGLTIAGFIPGVSDVAAVGSIIMDTYKTAKEISQCP